jgi:hypothetical protein
LKHFASSEGTFFFFCKNPTYQMSSSFLSSADKDDGCDDQHPTTIPANGGEKDDGGGVTVASSSGKNGKIVGIDILESLTLNDVDFNDDGNALGVFGTTWDKLPVKQVRTICSKFGVKGVKNVKKSAMIDVLAKWCANRKVYDDYRIKLGMDNDDAKQDERSSTTAAPRKGNQCAFRLMNLLFSDAFAGEFALLGNVATRETLDTGKAGNDQIFWERVQAAFVDGTKPNADYDCLQFTDEDEVFAEQEHHIDPSVIVQHDWKRLRKMWKAVNSDYKAALTRFTVSGTHDDNFFGFCNGKLETYYLRNHLNRKPQLNGMVEAALPDECFVSSDMPISELQLKVENQKNGSRKNSSSSSSAPLSNKKQKTVNDGGATVVTLYDNSDLVEAIREFGSSQRRAEIASQRMHYLVKEESRRSQQVLLGRYEKMQKNIRLLRRDLRDKRLKDCTRNELERELEGITNKKNELAKELGFI